ncbi:ABC transporter ATP-binding protein [Actinoallomurus acaciae]|uniref:ABC transporter ATP-binding protein n=1 Tax=Actinoallomurus acaciae TaxID=502577 RepID=A0ABV5YF14_9ACTN
METSRLAGTGLTFAYDDRVVIDDVDIVVPDGSFTVIIGPNASGKSTLLKTLSKMVSPKAGSVVLDGKDIHRYSTKEIARRLSLLPQSALVPSQITVGDLVARGRFPHQSIFRRWSVEDEHVVAEAMTLTGVADIAHRYVDELSGGQRQRAWLAMVLAQQTRIVLLDEPTTYLDIAHQYDVLDLCAGLRRDREQTLVAVLHDLNQSCRYATHLVVMSEGAIVATGRPEDVVSAPLVADVFGLPCTVVPDPVTGTPMIIPSARAARTTPSP